MKTLLPVTALIALVAAGPLAWAQDSHDTSAGPTGGDAKAQSDAQSDANSDAKPCAKPDAQNTAGNSTVAMAAAQPNPVCNHRSNTVACGVKSIPHEPGVPPVNPAGQAPAPAQ